MMQNKDEMLILGLTGGIGCGKTAVLTILKEEYDAYIIEADRLAHELMEPAEFDRMMEQPQNNPYHKYNVGVHSMEAVKVIEPTTVCRWAALLHDVGKPECHTVDENGIDHFYGHNEKGAEIARKVLRRLRFDNETTDLVCKMVLWHDYGLGEMLKKTTFRKALSRMGADFFPYYIKIRRADMAAQSDYKLEERRGSIEHLEKLYQEITDAKDCLTIKQLAINGKDLIALGVKPGKEIGDILQELLNQVLGSPELNNRETLLSMAESYIRK